MQALFRRARRTGGSAALCLAAAAVALTGCSSIGKAAQPSGGGQSSSPTREAGPLIRNDLAYAPDGDPMHRLDLYLPTNGSDKPAPVLVWVHGGGWRMGDKTDVGMGELQVAHLRDALRARGIAVASVNYHLLPQTRFPQPMQDVSAAVRYLKAQADTLGLDPARVALGGESAGAHLAAMVALTPADDPLHGTIGGAGDPSVRALLGYYGIYQLTTRSAQQTEQGCGGERKGAESSHGRLIGADPDAPEGRAAAEKASPITYVRPTSPATMLVHGRQDCTAPYRQSSALSDKLKAAGVEQHLELIDAGHAWSTFYTDEALRAKAVDFLVAHLR